MLALVATAGAAQAEPRGNFAHRLLEAHNAERDRARLPRLSWSAELARDAHDWAVQLARKGALQHAHTPRHRHMGENV